jgi:tryptophan synthase alpha subunit
MVAGGADVMEIEIPFSDPLADGPTIQRAAFQSLKNGTTPASCIEYVQRARGRHPETPIIVMTYLNPVMAYGVGRFAVDAAAAGADGVILVDMPPEEVGAVRETFDAAGLDIICLVAPTSTDERLEMMAATASGFIYCVSLTGVTGARENLPEGLSDFIARVRRCTDLPLAVGFGISRREHIDSLKGVADGVVVGSALIDLLGKSKPEDRTRAIREYVEELCGRRPA